MAKLRLFMLFIAFGIVSIPGASDQLWGLPGLRSESPGERGARGELVALTGGDLGGTLMDEVVADGNGSWVGLCLGFGPIGRDIVVTRGAVTPAKRLWALCAARF